MSKEYIEEENSGPLARDLSGKLFRIKCRVTLSYKCPPGRATNSTFKQVQVNLRIPEGLYSEVTQIKHEVVSMNGGSTPLSKSFYLYVK